MPKRPKAKVRTNVSTDKVVSPAKQKRIDKQALQELNNKENWPALSTWEAKKGNRRAARILQGKHEQWLTKQARLATRPNASNLLTGHEKNYNNRGSLVKSPLHFVDDGAHNGRN